MNQRTRLLAKLKVAILVILMAAFGSLDAVCAATGPGGWVERRPAGDTDLEWYALASDASGDNLIAAAFGVYGMEGWVYISTDAGATWTIRYPIATSQFWRAAASDADGSNLIVAAWAGRLYTSSNGGAGWTERQPAGPMDQRWQTVASDADGSNLIAGTSAGRLWVSSDGGKTWSETRPAGDVPGDWRGASSNADGSVLLVGNYAGRLYLTTNGGANWKELAPAGLMDRNWQGTACDEDGRSLIAGVEGGRLYTSRDRGSTWTERRPAGDSDRNWSRVASDADGSVLMAADEARLYVSRDSGATWSEQRPAGDRDLHWTCCSDADGSNLAVAAYGGGRLYTLVASPLARTLTVSHVGSGTVVLDPPGGTYDNGTVVTAAATAGAGYTFSGWSGDVSGTANPIAITMSGDRTVTATFVSLAAYAVTPSAGTGGHISPGAVQSVLKGGSTTFTIVPEAGYQIADVSVDGMSQGVVSSYTFANVTVNHTIGVRFEKAVRQTVLVLQIGQSAFTVNGDARTLDSPPIIANGRTLVPIRAIIEALGGAVGWDGTARKATVNLGAVTIELWIGQSVARVNNTSTRIDATNLKVVPEIVNGRTMLPLRFISEKLGCVVEWADATQIITITYEP